MSSKPAGPLVAYDPAELDKSIQRYVRVAERNISALEEIGGQITPLLERVKPLLEKIGADEVLDHTERITIVYDRQVKASMNLTKAIDELARLRSFLSGGPDSRPDLSAASEIELRAILVKSIQALGLTPDDLRQLLAAE